MDDEYINRYLCYVVEIGPTAESDFIAYLLGVSPIGVNEYYKTDSFDFLYIKTAYLLAMLHRLDIRPLK